MQVICGIQISFHASKEPNQGTSKLTGKTLLTFTISLYIASKQVFQKCPTSIQILQYAYMQLWIYVCDLNQVRVVLDF